MLYYSWHTNLVIRQEEQKLENEMELQQIIYKTLAVQIEFGVYRFEEQLPTIEEASQLFLVSTDTVRSAYLRLKHDGYITLSRSVGALVKVSMTQRIPTAIYRTSMPSEKML